jgi:hypothetical protein
MRSSRWSAVILLGLAASGAFAAQGQAAAGGARVKASFQVEMSSRTLTWDEDTRSSRLFNPQGLVTLDYQVAPGFDLGLIVGYSLSNWNGLVFRSLPFSLDYQGGSINGLVVGAGLHKSLFVSGFWELETEARFTAYLGPMASFPVAGLGVEGQADLKGSWMRVEAGPVLSFRGFELFSPFLGVFYDRIWGRMTLTEIIGDLEGTEEKKVAGAGAVAVTLGTVYEPSSAFRVKLGGTLIPFKKIGGGLGLDYGGSVRAMLSF